MVSTTPVAEGVERPRRRRGLRSRTERLLSNVIAVLGALGAAFAGAHPTGLDLLDIVWCGAFGLLVGLAASRSRRWPWLWLAGLATAGAVGSPWIWAGLASLVLAVVGAFDQRRNRILGAAIGAIAVQALLRMPAFGFHGLPSLVAFVAVAPMLWSAYERSPAKDRRRIWRTCLFAGVAVVLALLGLGITAITARSQLQRGVNNAKGGLDAARNGDQATSVSRFDTAATSFRKAQDELSAFWALPARALPVVNQQVDALLGAAESGGSVSRAASFAASNAPYKELRSSAGQIDVAKVAAMQPPVAASAQALERARRSMDAVSSPWLLAPIADPIASFTAEIDRTIPEVDLAVEGLTVSPGMLGAWAPHHYLVLFTTPSETRFLGGFTGAYGILTADRGKVSLTESGKMTDLNKFTHGQDRTLTDFPEFLERYGRYDPARFFQNVTASPDFPTDAAVARDLYRQATGVSVDGVMVADPYAIASLLKLTGPVTVDGLGLPLTAENAAQYLLVDQYLQFATNDDERNDGLGDAARATFDALTRRDLPGPRALGDALGPAMRQGRLLFTSFDPAEETFLEHLGSTGPFQPTPGADYVSVRTANANANKIDSFLQRSITYDASYTPETGQVDATATVSLTNTAPSEGLPRYIIGNSRDEPPGTNTMYLSFYTPLQVSGATITSADGTTVPAGVEPQTEFGSTVYSMLVSVPAGSTVTVTFDMSGTLAPGLDYRLDVLNQPTAHDDQLSVNISGAASTLPVKHVDGLDITDGRARFSGTIGENQQFRASFGNR